MVTPVVLVPAAMPSGGCPSLRAVTACPSVGVSDVFELAAAEVREAAAKGSANKALNLLDVGSFRVNAFLYHRAAGVQLADVVDFGWVEQTRLGLGICEAVAKSYGPNVFHVERVIYSLPVALRAVVTN